MNVALIPVYDRAELLHHTLRNIEKADGAKDILFLFKPDQRTKGEVLEVMGAFKFPFQVIPYGQPPRIPGLMRQSWNVLNGYGVAARTAGEGGLVYMVESDVMVARDFFAWHTLTHRSGSFFCSIASEDSNTTKEERPERPVDWPLIGVKWSADTLYSSNGTYRSIGVAWKAQVLHDLIAPHCKTEYFLSPQRYVSTHFPINPWGTTWCEQDGLIRRIQLNSTLPIAYPFEPKCYHAGYYGGNRGNTRRAPKGTLQAKIEQVGGVIYSDEEMRAHAPNEGFYLDSRPIDLGHDIAVASAQA